MEVPCRPDPAGVGVVDQDFDLVVVGLWLGERVVQHDVNVIDDWAVRVDLGNDDAVVVSIEEVGQPDEHDVVVINKRDADRTGHRDVIHSPERKHP